MRTQKIIKILLTLITIVVLFSVNKVNAQDVCDDNGFIEGTWCPCAPDPALASICGLVSDANLSPTSIQSTSGVDHPTWTTREPVGGVTVSIYENNPSVSTGKIFGKLDSKLIECETTPPPEGKYHCLMRRLNPGNLAYVIFSCGGKIADIKIVSSVRSIVDLDADIDCTGTYEYRALPGNPDPDNYEFIDIADRDNILGCMSTYEDEVNPNAGFFPPEQDFLSTIVGEKGGDIRFDDHDPFFSIFGFSVGGHPGALWEQDCVLEYLKNNNFVNNSFPREYSTFETEYQSVQEKCNLDPDDNGDGALDGDDGDPLNDSDELTVPFRYDIPTLDKEHEQVRVWENRVSLQREMQDPRAFAQYNHLMFGDCVQNVTLRYYGDTEEPQPIPCSALITCGQTLGNPIRNLHTSMSFGARLENPAVWGEIITDQERDNADVVCRDPDYGDITIAEVQPPNPPDPCIPGTSGCRYKLPSTYYFPQFMVLTGGIKKPRVSETIGDAYGGQARSVPWEGVSTEASPGLHTAGHYENFEDATSQKNNSGMTAIRIANDTEGVTDGVMVNRFVSFADAITERYDYNASEVIWDLGGDVKSLCSISSVNSDYIIPSPAEELLTFINNRFRGSSVDHDPTNQDPDYDGDQTAGTATYATAWGIARDEYLKQHFWRDVLDSLQRFSSGDGRLEEAKFSDYVNAFYLTLVSHLRGENPDTKSFADRKNGWNFSDYSYMFADYCIGENTFEGVFPAYGESGYPGDAGACYPWEDVPLGGSCNSWPGKPSDWPRIPGNVKSDLGYPGGWPGIEGELRTCKLNVCQVRRKIRECDEFRWKFIWNATLGIYEYVETDICDDWDLSGDVDYSLSGDTRPCTEAQERECLTQQEDNFVDSPNWEDWPEPPLPPRLRAPDYDTQITTAVVCDLEKAGPMKEPGDIWKDDLTRITQKPFWNESQKNIERVSQSSNYTKLALSGPMNRRSEDNKAGMTDAATSNDINTIGEAGYDSSGQIQGGGMSVVHKDMAGMNTEGFGTGASVGLLKIISHPIRPGVMAAPFPPMHQACNYYNDDSWCHLIPVPGAIDLDSMGSSRCEPNVTSAACPLTGQIGNLAQRILGSAGEAFNVPGSLLLAVIEGEGGWLSGNRMNWDDTSIASYSEPWSARIPQCNDMVIGAQGPFGWLDGWFKAEVWGCDPSEGECYDIRAGSPIIDPNTGEPNPNPTGGFHPSRVNSDLGIVVSKCNFIDAAYAAAHALSAADISCGGSSDAAIRRELATYRGQSEDHDSLDRLIDIVQNCR